MMLFFLHLILSIGHAEIEPTVSITVEGNTTEFLLLSSGTRLDFSTPGPKKIAIESRRRMAGAAQRAGTAPITAVGDGNLILTIRVPGTAVASGTINDKMGGYPSKPDRSVVTVPDGGKVLTVEAPIGGPDFLIRVVDRTWPDRLVTPIHSSLIDEDIGDPEISEAEEPIGDQEEIQQEIDSSQTERPMRSKNAPDDLRPAAGVKIGFGIPSRGNKMVFAMAATGRYPIYKDLISLGGSLGWHRIGVEEQVAIANPIAGDLTYAANWHTTVIPIVAQGNIHVPFPAGPITPIASAGMGMYIATRTDGSDKTTNLALGPTFGLGAEADIPVGQIQATVSWHEARARFGNQSTDGSAVRESLAVSQLNVAYLYVF
jgi:hypothetical protein